MFSPSCGTTRGVPTAVSDALLISELESTRSDVGDWIETTHLVQSFSS
jgi:hypothetical protein